MTAYGELEEAVSFHVSRVEEKARREELAVEALLVFIQTSRFQKSCYYGNSRTAILPYPTDYTPDILKAAVNALKSIYREGYKYSKAGVIFTGLVSARCLQTNILEANETFQQDSTLIQAIDRINKNKGRDSVFFASSGIDRVWKMRQERRSPRYTTQWNELLCIYI